MAALPWGTVPLGIVRAVLSALCAGVSALAAQSEWRSAPCLGRFIGPAVYDLARDAFVVPSPGFGAWLWQNGSWQAQRGPSPQPRAGYALCYDPQGARVLLFGGEIYSSLTGTYSMFDDLWGFDAAGWRQLTSVHRPPPRGQTAMAIEPSTGFPIVCGGHAGMLFNLPVVLNDTWRWQGTDWVQMAPGPTVWMHSMASGPATGVVLFSGTTPAETWIWDQPAGVHSWRRASTPNAPSPRSGQGMTYDTQRNRVLLYGGELAAGGGSIRVGDLWEWDGQQWSAGGVAPIARKSAAMGFDPIRGRLLLGGGFVSVQEADGDLWQGTAGSWTPLRGLSAPSVDANAAVAWDAARDRLLLVGGSRFGVESDRQWEWDGREWTEQFASPRLAARIGAAIVTDTDRRRILLFGGSTQGVARNDFWEWDGSQWRQLQASTMPSARSAAGIAYDSLRRRVVMFGGFNILTSLGDTWQWDGTTWTQMSSQQAPTARAGMAMAFDALRGVVVAFGGTGLVSPGGTWEWNGASWSPYLQGLQPALNGRWMTMAFDAHRQRCVLAGTGTYGPETWEWDGANWSQLLTGSGPNLAIGPAVYDPVQRRIAIVEANSVWYHGAIAPAAVESFAAGCPGVQGVPALTLDGDAQPWLGDTLTARVASVPAGAAALLWLGGSRTQWGTQALPLSLVPFGLSGCALAASPDDISRLAIANATGDATFALSVPPSPLLIGLRVFVQAGATDAAANAAGLVVTNALALQLGSR